MREMLLFSVVGKIVGQDDVLRLLARIENVWNQAVAYLVALKFLLTQDDAVARRAWWRLLEFSKQPNHMPRLEAFAYVADNPENRSRLEKACRRLATANRKNIVVAATFY